MDPTDSPYSMAAFITDAWEMYGSSFIVCHRCKFTFLTLLLSSLLRNLWTIPNCIFQNGLLQQLESRDRVVEYAKDANKGHIIQVALQQAAMDSNSASVQFILDSIVNENAVSYD
jgi:hypothetical protein